MTYSGQQFASPQEALVHYGVKGMRWGVRKEDSPAQGTAPEPKAKMSRNKKIAIGVGALTVAAGVGYAAYSLNKNGKLPISSFRTAKKSVDLGRTAAEKIVKEPTELIHLARGKNTTLTFLKKGGTEDFFSIFDKAGMNSPDKPHTFFEKLSDGKIAARMADPLGRTDFAGRPIGHDLVIPKSMTDGLSSLSDIEKKIWPLIKDNYDAFYEESLKPKH